ncbi:TDP-N-acetylfucosamine:lipid II N-acetylfucosaminyltransferase [Neptunicella sp.]|uniref:TDP-N-acetylfucosamine:lipid II N-acetylfucosaminyltransferase n=1 Tax=Neptunicella sp. TaxID=2125986 RepID=UPI003F68CD5A
MKYLHIMISEKFMPPYIDFINKHFNINEHQFFYITSEKYDFGLTPSHGVKFCHTTQDFDELLAPLYQADKIFLHGLWRDKINQLLLKHSDLLKKTYWILWGGDFYSPELKNQAHHEVIKNVGHYISLVEGDVAFIKKWYKAQGEQVRCFAYTSNLYKAYPLRVSKRKKKNVLVGNSAALNNNHIQILDRLIEHRSNLGKIIVPLSYANLSVKGYAEHVVEHGKSLFGERFVPLMNFLSFDEYLTYLQEIDIAIFDHNRQQGVGTLITLLSLGVKVFMRPSISMWDTFTSQNLKVFDINQLSIESMTEADIMHNIESLNQHYSEDTLVAQWKTILN